MSHVNIFESVKKLKKASKDEIIVDIATRRNVRFNDLARLVDEVCSGLEEGLRGGFLCMRRGKFCLNYTLDSAFSSTRKNSAFTRNNCGYPFKSTSARSKRSTFNKHVRKNESSVIKL